MEASAGNRTLTAVEGLRVGHAQDAEARTGCTAVLGPFVAAAEIRGLATGTRELDVLSSLHLVPRCDALLLTGGSAFGLAAADGVVRWLEERGRGFPTGAARVPIVPAAVIYDLGVGRSDVRPGREMGYAAAEAAGPEPVPAGRRGAGCGATVGKLRGSGTGEPGGLGSWSARRGETVVGALAVLNAFGDVWDGAGGILAGCRDDDGDYLDTAKVLREGAVPAGYGPPRAGGAEPEGGRSASPTGPAESTTLAVVATDAALGKRELRIVARQAMNGLVRRVRPSGTPFDGDLVFALSTGEGGREIDEPGEVLALGLRAEEAVEQSIDRALAASASPVNPATDRG